MKSTLLLATALFLISAPEPDSNTIAEMTANFLVPQDERALLASDLVAGPDNSDVWSADTQVAVVESVDVKPNPRPEEDRQD